MPTIKQLPAATSVSASDVLPISQGGSTRGVTVGGLLSSAQTAISLATGKLLGRVSSTAGGPEPIGLGAGLALSSGNLGATGVDHLQFAVSASLATGDEVVVNSAGVPKRMPAVFLRTLFSAGTGVSIDDSGAISSSGTAVAAATTSTTGVVKVGSGLTVAVDGTIATDNAALSIDFVTNDAVRSTVQAAVAVAAPSAGQFGAKGDGVFDNLGALQRYIDTVVAAGGGECVILPGRYMVSGTLTAVLSGNTSLSIRGSGADLTELLFSGDTDGIVATYSSQADYRRDVATGAKLRLFGLSVVRMAATAGRDGIRVVGDTANAAGVIEPTTVIDEVTIRGTSGGGGWSNHLVYQDVANTSTTQVTCVAANANSALASSSAGVVIRTTGSRFSTLHAVKDLNTWACDMGMSVGERIQGVEVINSNFTGGNYGIHWNSVGRQEQLSVVNCQFSTLVGGIYAYNLQNVQITNSTFYNQNAYAGSPGTWIAVDLVEVDNSQIVGNGIMGGNVGLEVGVHILNDLSVVASNRPTTISGNTFSSLKGEVLHTENNTTNVLFTCNNSDAITGSPPVVIGSGTSVSFAGNQFASTLYVIGYPGGLNALATGPGTLFTSAPTHPSPAFGDSSTASATTAFVQGAVGLNGARITTGSSYAMGTGDRFVVVAKAARSATSITLPSTPVLWATYSIKDGNGDASVNPITVTGNTTIDGATSFVLNANWACVSLVFNGLQWSVA